jgi:hypothetical protein
MAILDELAQRRHTVLHSRIGFLAFSSALDRVITQVIKMYFFFFQSRADFHDAQVFYKTKKWK